MRHFLDFFVVSFLAMFTGLSLGVACSPAPISACERAVAELGAVYAVRVRLECKRGDASCPTFQEYFAKRKALDLQCLPQSKQ